MWKLFRLLQGVHTLWLWQVVFLNKYIMQICWAGVELLRFHQFQCNTHTHPLHQLNCCIIVTSCPNSVFRLKLMWKVFIATCGFPSSSMSTLIPVGSSLRVPFVFLIGSSSHHPPQEDEDCECHDGSLHCRFCSNCKYLAVRGFQLDVHFSLEDIWVFPKIMVPPNHPF